MAERSVLLIPGDECGWSSVRAILSDHSNVDIVGDTADARDAARIAAITQPEVLVTAAVVAGRPSAPLLVDILCHRAPRSRALVLADRLNLPEMTHLARLNVTGYLLWSSVTPAVLSSCLDVIIASDVNVASRAVVDAALIPRPVAPGDQALTAPALSAFDQTLLRRLADGDSQKEIARSEGVALRTVARHVSDLEAALDAPNQFVLAYRATLLGLLP